MSFGCTGGIAGGIVVSVACTGGIGGGGAGAGWGGGGMPPVELPIGSTLPMPPPIGLAPEPIASLSQSNKPIDAP